MINQVIKIMALSVYDYKFIFQYFQNIFTFAVIIYKVVKKNYKKTILLDKIVFPAALKWKL